ncbi:XRE family transcriptional regulator [Heyndrickxia ginsengihumi]|uniref:XRE family transcriptional regulator n=1 Tax=Heyndrickxia ginsengihumi TaxID=363870 RepID=UPI00190FB0DA|nr:XRE family transcriptional regulator [Heyndrickxia ginsengihumi]
MSEAYNYPYEKLLEIAGYIEMDKKNENDLPELNAKDEKDIAKKMESILKEMDSGTALAFDGEPMDEETKELVRAAIESNLILTKQIAKKKFTPKKYRKE